MKWCPQMCVFALFAMANVLETSAMAIHDESYTLLHNFTGHTRFVTSVAWSPDGSHLASTSWDRSIRIWDVTTGESVAVWTDHFSYILTVAWSPDGLQLASGSRNDTVQIWNFRSQVEESSSLFAVLEGHTDWVSSVAWKPGGTQIASSSRDDTIRIWDATTGESIEELTGPAADVHDVTWSPDGKRLAAASQDTAIHIWTPGESYSLRLISHTSSVVSVAWSPDGTKLASGGRDNSTRIWNPNTGGLLRTMLGHDDVVLSVSWSPDGRRLASASRDGTVRIWDPETGGVVCTLMGHTNDVPSVAWSPDGTHIASGSYDQSVLVWNVDLPPPRKTESKNSQLVWIIAVVIGLVLVCPVLVWIACVHQRRRRRNMISGRTEKDQDDHSPACDDDNDIQPNSPSPLTPATWEEHVFLTMVKDPETGENAGASSIQQGKVEVCGPDGTQQQQSTSNGNSNSNNNNRSYLERNHEGDPQPKPPPSSSREVDFARADSLPTSNISRSPPNSEDILEGVSTGASDHYSDDFDPSHWVDTDDQTTDTPIAEAELVRVSTSSGRNMRQQFPRNRTSNGLRVISRNTRENTDGSLFIVEETCNEAGEVVYMEYTVPPRDRD